MSSGFVGRSAELALLRRHLDEVAASHRGRAVAIRGRRQVGKSRLVQEFCEAADVNPVYLDPVPNSEHWPEAIRATAAATTEYPCVLVVDDDAGGGGGGGRGGGGVADGRGASPGDGRGGGIADDRCGGGQADPQFEDALAAAWEGLLSRRPVLLLLVGIDVRLTERPAEIAAVDLRPLDPAELALVLDLDATTAIDVRLVSGGMPGILQHWPPGAGAMDVVEHACRDPDSPFFAIPEAALTAEFPIAGEARRILNAIESGDRTYADIVAAVRGRVGGGGRSVSSRTLAPLLRTLVEGNGVLTTDHPLSEQAGKPTQYRVVDTGIRFYLAALRDACDLVAQGRPDSASRLVRRRWTTWRERAVQPLVRESLELAAAAGRLPWPEVTTVGGWWNQWLSPEVSLVGADRAPVARQVYFAGAIKWLESPFDSRDLAALRTSALAVPGFVPEESGHVVVSLCGTAPGMRLTGIDVAWGPDDVLSAWR